MPFKANCKRSKKNCAAATFRKYECNTGISVVSRKEGFHLLK